jgi:peptidoglycan/LPS O-acetylase OafA/YrhL
MQTAPHSLSPRSLFPDGPPEAVHSTARVLYYPLFDYLRIALALGVFVAHAGGAQRFGNMGNVCVQVFFALSGFLIGGILLDCTPRHLPRFFYNRATRIWVPYFLAIALLALGCVVKSQEFDLKLVEFLFYKATFVYNYFGSTQLAESASRMPLQATGNHLWSICVEEQFYLFAPFVLLFLPRIRVPVLIAIWLSQVFFPYSFGAITLGVLLAVSKQRHGAWYLRFPLSLALLVSLVVCSAGVWFGFIRYSLGVPIASVCTVALLAHPGASSPLGRLLGGVSYPFYLNHWTGLVLQRSVSRLLGVGPVISGTAALFIALAYATAHYWLVDRVILQHRGGWYTRKRGKVAFALAIGLFALGLAGGFLFRAFPPS